MRNYRHRYSRNTPYIIFALLAFLSISELQAQEDNRQKKFIDYTTIDVSYVAGGQLFNNTLLFTPGFAGRISVGKKIHQDIDVGIGSGYLSLKKEEFFPLYVEIVSYKNKKKNTPFIKFQVGHAFAGLNEESTAYKEFDLYGGIFFSATLGRRVRLNDKYTMLFQTSYCHQTARLKYKIQDASAFTDNLNYEMFLLSLGFVFN